MKVTSSHILKTKHLEDISNNGMLSDSIIQYFQNLIKKVHPSANGLQDQILGQKIFFKVQGSQPFVQGLYKGNHHWLAIST